MKGEPTGDVGEEVKRCAVQGQSGVMHGAAVGFNGSDVGAAGLDEGEHFLRTC